MRAILIGGPSHRHEFELNYVPPTWWVPVPRPMSIGDLSLDPKLIPVFETAAYTYRETLGGYLIYTIEWDE